MSTRSPRFSLSVWLTGAVVVTALTAVGCTVAMVESFAHRHAEQNATATLGLTAAHLRDALDFGMQQRFEEIASLAALAPLHESRSPDDVRAILDEIKHGFPDFAWIGLADAQGRVFAGTGRLLEGVNVAARPWFDGTKNGPYVGDVHSALLLERLLPRQREPWRFVDIAAPVRAAHGERVGVLAGHLSWDWARTVYAGLLAATRRADGIEILVVSREGNVLIGPKNLEGRTLPPVPHPGLDAKQAASAPNATRVEDGIAYFTVSTTTRGAGRYPGLGWSVVVRQPAELALADYRLLRNEILAVGGVVSALACLAAVVVARRLSLPLRRMSRSLKYGNGDIDVAEIGIYREAQQLARAFDALSSRQRAHAQELVAVNASLEARIEERTANLQDAQTMLRGITDNMPALIAYIDRDLRMQFCNATYLHWLHVDPRAHIGRPMSEIVSKEQWERRLPFIEQALTTGETVRFEGQTEIGGRNLDIETTYVPHLSESGEALGLYALSTDVTARKDGERAMEQLARVDTLTGLPNRYQLNEQLPLALARGRRTRTGVALLFVDVDHFKQVNDRLGHAAGDALLVHFAHCLSDCVRTTDLVARLAGDEFVVVIEGLHAAHEAEQVAAKLVAAVGRPMDWQGQAVVVGASVGVAYDGGCTAAPDELLSRADAALYDVKRAGRAGYKVAAEQGELVA